VTLACLHKYLRLKRLLSIDPTLGAYLMVFIQVKRGLLSARINIVWIETSVVIKGFELRSVIVPRRKNSAWARKIPLWAVHEGMRIASYHRYRNIFLFSSFSTFSWSEQTRRVCHLLTKFAPPGQDFFRSDSDSDSSLFGLRLRLRRILQLCGKQLYMLRSCFDLTSIAGTRSTFGNGCILSSFFSFILTSNN
jgi:hypothetical protein